jgi:hypothetical protein
MRSIHQLSHAVAVHEQPTGPMRRCRYCGHLIRLYERIGWLDVTASYLGGTYDMCMDAPGASHEPRAQSSDCTPARS